MHERTVARPTRIEAVVRAAAAKKRADGIGGGSMEAVAESGPRTDATRTASITVRTWMSRVSHVTSADDWRDDGGGGGGGEGCGAEGDDAEANGGGGLVGSGGQGGGGTGAAATSPSRKISSIEMIGAARAVPAVRYGRRFSIFSKAGDHRGSVYAWREGRGRVPSAASPSAAMA